MYKRIFINNYELEVKNFQLTRTNPRKVSFNFIVKHQDYHDITTLLYEADLFVKIPEEQLEFSAMITNYSTSITNLYKKGAEGEFWLELTEIMNSSK